MKRRLCDKKTLFALGCVYASSMHAAFAAEETPTELPAITVTAGRGSSLEKMDVDTTVMTREQVMRSPETSVEQILNKIPGIFSPQVPSNQIHPTGEVFSIRGFGTTTNINTLVMVDGIPVNDPYFRILNWGQIPKESIERIEVIRGGGASSLWGNLAMGGVVNIVLREPAPNENSINVSYGSFNTKTADVATTLFSSDRWKVGASFDGTKSDGYNQTPQEFRNPNMVPTASHSGNMNVSTYYTPSADSKYYLKVSGSLAQEYGLIWNDTSNSWGRKQISGGGTTRLTGGGSVNMNAWYNKGEMDTMNAGLQNGGAVYTFNILNPSVGTPYVSMIEQAKYHSLGGSLFFQNDFGDIKDTKIGLDLRNIVADDDLNFYNPPGTSNGSIFVHGEHRFRGLFAQGTYRAETIPLDVTVGLREDFFQTVNASLSGKLNANMEDKSYSQFDPRIGAKYYFANGVDMRAAVYRNFAAPGMNQMYRSFGSGTSFTVPNPDLTPQRNFGQEIGADYVQPGLDVAFTLFNNKLDNYIDYSATCTSLAACTGLATQVGFPGLTRGSQYLNVGNAVIKGAELIGNWQASEAVQLNGGFTRTIAYLTSSAYPSPIGTSPAPDPVHAQLGQVPGWMATLGSVWEATPGLKLTVQVKSFPEYWNNTAHTQLNSSATLADVGVTYKVTKAVDVYGSAQNIGNRHYYDSGLTTTTMNGSTLSTSGIPALGMPLNLNVGVRASF